MTIETRIDNRTASIFNNAHGETGWGYHNVGSVFSAGDAKLLRDIGAHYGQRCGHFPDTPSLGVIVEQRNDVIESQMGYISELMDKPITITTPDRFIRNGRSLAVPYMNNSATERMLRSLGLDVWGLPSQIVDTLKNKATCHELISQLAIPGFEAPEYRIINVNDTYREALDYLPQIEQSYQKVGMNGNYPIGVMLRGAESGGNYGACIVVEKDGQPVTIPDGDAKQIQRHANWEEALTKAQSYLLGTASANTDVEPRVIMSRFMDLEDSPGMSTFIIDGEVTSLGWNAQYQDAGGSACIGTSSYSPQNEYLRKIYQEQGESTAQAFENFLTAAIAHQGFDINSVRGATNVDLMIPGKLEREYQRRLGNDPKITIAEINPRFTSWTDALLTVVGASGKQKSIQEIIDARDSGVLEVIKYPLNTTGQRLEDVRDKISELDFQLKSSGTRILVRICDNPMGLIFSGNIERARSELDKMFPSN